MSSIRHALLPLLASLAFLMALPLHAADTKPAAKPAVRTDFFGDPLPPGVRFRLGTVRLRHDGAVRKLAWLPDGCTLASDGCDNTVRLWQIPGGKPLANWRIPTPVTFSRDGRTMSWGDDEGMVRIRDLASGKELQRVSPERHPDAFSPDGKVRVAVEKKKVRLYAADTGKEIGSLEKMLQFPALMFSPDSHNLLVLTTEGVYRWTISTDVKSKLAWHDKDSLTTTAIVLSPDSKMLAAAADDEDNSPIMLRSWPAGEVLRRLQIENDSTHALAFSPDGKLLAAGEERRGNIHLWDPTTGKQLYRFEGHRRAIKYLAFSPDGSLLASGDADGIVNIVDPGNWTTS